MNQKQNFMKWNKLGVALITGASSGIGASYARSLSAQGFETILVARRKERLEDLARELERNTSNKAEVVVADLSKLEDINSVAEKIKELNNLDVLVNNAGFGSRGYFENQPLNVIKDIKKSKYDLTLTDLEVKEKMQVLLSYVMVSKQTILKDML